MAISKTAMTALTMASMLKAVWCAPICSARLAARCRVSAELFVVPMYAV